MSLTPTQIASLLESHSGDPVLYLFKLKYNNGVSDQYLYFVNNNVDFISAVDGTSRTYSAVNVNCTLAKRESSTINSANISFVNINREISDIVQTISSAIEITVYVVLESVPDSSIVGDLTYKLLNVTFNALTISGELADLTYLDDVSSKYFQTAQLFPCIHES